MIIIECYQYQVIKLLNDPIYKYPLGSAPVPRTMPTIIGHKRTRRHYKNLLDDDSYLGRQRLVLNYRKIKLLCELCNYRQLYDKATYHNVFFVDLECFAKENERWWNCSRAPHAGSSGCAHPCSLCPPLSGKVSRTDTPAQPSVSWKYLTRQLWVCRGMGEEDKTLSMAKWHFAKMLTVSYPLHLCLWLKGVFSAKSRHTVRIEGG